MSDDLRPSVTLNLASSFSISPTTGIVGSTVKVSGSGFAANTLVVVEVDGEAVTTGRTDALGNFSDVSFTVPERPYGTISIKVTVGTTVKTGTFTIKPNITNVFPIQAKLNDSVTVDGTGFGASEPLQVLLGMTVVSITDGDVTRSNGNLTTTFAVPNGLTSTEPLAVTVRGTTTDATATSSDKLTLTGGLISVNPTQGAVKTPVEVFGTHPVSIANAIVGYLTFGGQTITVANDGLAIVNGVGSLVGDEIVTNASGYYHVQFLVPVVPAGEYDISIGNESLPFTVVTRFGDISGDDNITAYDASLALQYVVGLIELSPEQQYAADVTGDGKVSALDAALILQYSVGLITVFPKGQPGIAPALHPKSKDKLLMEAIEQLGIASLNNDQKQVLDQLKQLVSERMIPARTALFPNYPNPFNPDTWIPYQLKEASDVAINIYNVAGQLVRTIRLGHKSAGLYVTKEQAVHWAGRNNAGDRVASGIYFYRLKAGAFTSLVYKMVILK